MIIIETKNGATFVNERKTHVVQHDKNFNMVVIRSAKNGLNCCIHDVESVTYISDAQSVRKDIKILKK